MTPFDLILHFFVNDPCMTPATGVEISRQCPLF